MIGVLDLQGDVVEHLDHLDRLGLPAKRVKTPRDLAGIKGLIIPGGESTCLSRLMKLNGLDRAIVDLHRQGVKLWGTCAGAILLARHVIGEKPHLPLIDIEIERNGFGSQLDSFAAEAYVPAVSPRPLTLIFIRAPKIKRCGPGVKVLIEREDYIAAAEDDAILVTAFHPELTPDSDFHLYFARKCGMEMKKDPGKLPPWSTTSWTRFARVA
ncbi:MAG TPA: pyridoxal 5'-phosphate synthase glutaminase subunit PdxT [Syntrophales bacterium]|nr:pyridoxal 5'-phosphate synthase glutaminase subunit PdxT [Syntrophales bacterium]HOL59650.1 pyridoxal 5'-phosphate synthase glutaminase subunit PdxT [Syntrophales bacterium]HPO35796.1 pyridoxal 5'-phosphate synthase glutaminase subunit PdxT [Syntrophales bacterium]